LGLNLRGGYFQIEGIELHEFGAISKFMEKLVGSSCLRDFV
jgi:hypothetical protein